MDPASIIGLTAAIQQLLSCVYSLGHGVYEAKREINQLCSEILELKAALEHIQLNTQLDDLQIGSPKVPHSILSSSNFTTPEFRAMLSSTNNIIQELLARFDQKPGRFRSSMHRLAWPFVKDGVKNYIDRLERSKS